MQHKSNKQHKSEKHEKLNSKHKPSFYVTASAISVFTAVLSTAAFAAYGVISTGIKILSL
jgi:hypothetical protein